MQLTHQISHDLYITKSRILCKNYNKSFCVEKSCRPRVYYTLKLVRCSNETENKIHVESNLNGST